MVDYAGAAAVALSGFFVVIAVALLARYRQVSERVKASSDLGRDLWGALEGRLKKQDERILDLMGKVEVMEARFSTVSQVASQVTSQAAIPARPVMLERPRAKPSVAERLANLDKTERMVLKLLGDGPRSSVEIKQAIDRSREHTARLMKALFERGLVSRDDSQRPFVYRLTDAGRNYLSVT